MVKRQRNCYMSLLSRFINKKKAQFKLYQYYNYPIKRLISNQLMTKELSDNNLVDIVSIAFNNPLVIEYQIKFIKKNIQNHYCYLVADNSTDDKAKAKIRELCLNNQVSYCELPPNNPYKGTKSSDSHGIALNWIYINYIKVRKPRYFGFIDHDIFPVEQINIADLISPAGLWGVVEEREKIWYLWPGLSFFDFSLLKGKNIDFLPGDGGDTGAKNWKSLYSQIDKSSVKNPQVHLENLREGGDKQSDVVQFIGNWIHTINASEWKVIKDNDHKQLLIVELLNGFL